MTYQNLFVCFRNSIRWFFRWFSGICLIIIPIGLLTGTIPLSKFWLLPNFYLIFRYFSKPKTDDTPQPGNDDTIHPKNISLSRVEQAATPSPYWDSIVAITPGVSSTQELASYFIHEEEYDKALEIYEECFEGMDSSDPGILEGISLASHLKGDDESALQTLMILMNQHKHTVNEEFRQLFNTLQAANS